MLDVAIGTMPTGDSKAVHGLGNFGEVLNLFIGCPQEVMAVSVLSAIKSHFSAIVEHNIFQLRPLLRTIIASDHHCFIYSYLLDIKAKDRISPRHSVSSDSIFIDTSKIHNFDGGFFKPWCNSTKYPYPMIPSRPILCLPFGNCMPVLRRRIKMPMSGALRLPQWK